MLYLISHIVYLINQRYNWHIYLSYIYIGIYICRKSQTLELKWLEMPGKSREVFGFFFKNFPITSRLLPAISSHFNSKVCNLRRSKALKESFPEMYSHICQLYFFPNFLIWRNREKGRK